MNREPYHVNWNVALGDLTIMDVTSEANMGACPGAKTKKNNYSISEDNFFSTWNPKWLKIS